MLPQAARRARDARLQRPPGVAGAGVPWCAGRGGTQQAVAAFLLAGARGGSLASVRVGGQVTVQKERPQGPCTSGVAARWSVPFARRGGGGGFAIFDEVLIFVKNLTNYLFYHFVGTIAELPYRF